MPSLSSTAQSPMDNDAAAGGGASPTMLWDYVAFVVFVVGSTAYPIWDELRGRKAAASKQSYVFATGRVSIFAIMMSLARGSLGVRTIIGYPSELFYRGSAMFECIYGIALAYPLVLWIFVPVFLRLDVTSVYQYLDLRFNSRLVRCLASGTFIVRSLLNIAITIYTPAVAIYTIVGVPHWASLLTLTGISICFTLFGGLKAAITADVIQGITILTVSAVVLVMGVLASDGFGNVFARPNENGRFQFLHVGDLSTRIDTVSALLGQGFIQLSMLGCQQNLMQRYMSLGSKEAISTALYLNIPFLSVLFTVPWLCGIVVYAVYAYCDPRQLGLTKAIDEILPFFVLDKLLVIPCCVGLFLASLFNGALCIFVSNLNSLATVMWEDFLSQLPRFRDLPDCRQLYAIKAIGVLLALLTLGMSFSVGMLSGIIEIAQLINAASSGPLIGVFLLGMLVPVANWKGATAGILASLAFGLVWSVGFLATPRVDKFLETSIDGCTNDTFSPWIQVPEDFVWQETPAVVEVAPVAGGLFTMSYMYYSVFGTLIALLVGTAVGWATDREEDRCEEYLLNPYLLVVLRRFGYRPQTGSTVTIAKRCDSVASVSMTIVAQPERLSMVQPIDGVGELSMNGHSDESGARRRQQQY